MGNQTNKKGSLVGKHVPRVGLKGKGTGDVAGHEFGDKDNPVENDHKNETPGHLVMSRGGGSWEGRKWG